MMAPHRWILTLALLGGVVGCAAGAAHGGTLPPLEIPEPPEPPRLGIRALWVAYQGAEGAPSDLVRTRQQASDRALMLSEMGRVAGEDFDALVRKYSDRPALGDPGGEGVLVERGNGVLPKDVEDVAFQLEVGDVSRPVETPEGFVIVKRTVTPDGTPKQIAARHILVSYEGAQGAGSGITRSKEEAMALAERIRGDASAADSDWDALVEEHSDEPNHAPGGDLGTFEKGRMVPAFERAAFALDVGQISSVVETPFGFHVIQRYR